MRILLTLAMVLTLGLSVLPAARATGIAQRTKDDLRQVAAIISDANTAHETMDAFFRTLLPIAQGELDPARAMTLATEGESEEVLANTIVQLAAIDPPSAARWAPQRLALLHAEPQRTFTILSLGANIARIAPDLTAELYRQAQLPPGDLTQEQQAIYQAQLAMLAVRVHDDAAPGYLYKAFTLARQLETALAVQRSIIRLFLPHNTDLATELVACGTAANEPFAQVCCALAQGRASAAAALAAVFPPRMQRHVYLECIRIAAYNDPALAYRLLAVLKANKPRCSYTDPELYPVAVQYIIIGSGRRNPARALALAYTVRDQMTRLHTLVLAAQYQPRETALRVLHETVRHFYTSSRVNIGDLAFAARTAYAFDPQVARAIFAQAIKYTDKRTDFDSLKKEAFYGAQVAPASCRSLIETRLSSTSDFWQNIDLVQIMAAIDVKRAREMLAALPYINQRREARCRVVGYLLVPPSVRGTLTYDWWNQLGVGACACYANSPEDPGFITLTPMPTSL